MKTRPIAAALPIAVIAVFLLGCTIAPPPASEAPDAAEQQDPNEEIAAALADYQSAWVAQDMEKMMAVYSDEYADIQNITKPIIRDYLSGIPGVLLSTSVGIAECEIAIDGDWATVGPVTYDSPSGRTSSAYRMKKETDGVWRFLSSEPITASKAPKPLELKREDGKVWIDGLQEMDWGGAIFRREDSQVACLVEVLRSAGEDVTYADVMGLSGAAFKMTMSPNLFIGQIHSEFGLDWTEIMLRIWGMDYKDSISCNEEDNPDWRDELREAAVESINEGLPLIYMDGEFSLIVGYREDRSAYITKPYAGFKPGYEESETPRGFLGNAWTITALRRTGRPADWRESVIASLHRAVKLAKEGGVKERGGGDGAFAAYETWIATLEEGEGVIDTGGNAFSYTQLLSSRQAAAEYLRKVADALGGQVANHLRTAAGFYETIAQRLDDGKACVSAWDKSWTPENREKEASLLRLGLADEQRAIGEIERALEADQFAQDTTAFQKSQ